ncbi:exodeoxyribonuclease VII large subunit [Lactobacillus kefiranofaciens]|uniref:Exodeoxyribonuclease 7 large subunit n=1 Tax=Lactobacillus kefiranofaciens TaxID=267818 RepID=A0AAX3UFV8_9LACO|nr:exodeoxyribonuclease VII large subunit [Lactobacillus kefiranofaciens]AEG40077.1 Exodeoxyribonuclease 7 large subunit [Lactobacillus kefiranofaciens subsp. kefiranofaciens]KRM23197.1 exodeoxyribonuclease 7 large subunit [Lactobacillus kefiranofaciens subsp. kefiranofaciens DSM 5016 = JCM 6985]QFQ67659.1 exodeoxyribonuclease VII large subunit [Lactobacillus kefiranofaciens subsp. kefiranofaciens]WGO86585.1 exodeoxyribonuclease VII large subunit [Lactobacillus kefiranofaciens]WQH36095.1 exode
MTENKYLTVTDLNYYITQKFKNDPYLHKVFLEGELSNFRYRRNSHQYFSLKDEKSKINVVMFRSYFDKVKFKPEEGMKVYVVGYVSVYGPQGSYQFYAEKMEPAGLGALYEQLKQLQAKLAKEGLFDPEHKRSLPRFPDRIAVVTSASGAVIHDIMVTANRRFPHAEIDLYPAQVQGDTAAESLVHAMQQIAAQGDKYDVMIIGRGGGSLEDLWPFNEEEVVRQVYSMPMPVISSVGHETDTTLCDLVADARAATPTAAAEYATPNLTDELAGIHQLQSRLLASMQAIIRVRRDQLKRIENSVIMREPTRLYDQQIQQVDLLNQRLQNGMQNKLDRYQQNYRLLQQRLISASPVQSVKQMKQQRLFLSKRLTANMQHYLKNQRNRFTQIVQQLDDYSLLKTLERGFVYTTNDQGKTISSTRQIKPKDQLNLHFKDGQVTATVIKVEGKYNAN